MTSPLAVKAQTAAAMLDMPQAEFMQLAEAGASDAEIQAVTGQNAMTVAYYRSQANKRHLSRVAQNRREKE